MADGVIQRLFVNDCRVLHLTTSPTTFEYNRAGSSRNAETYNQHLDLPGIRLGSS